jgi:hypothetical protein
MPLKKIEGDSGQLDHDEAGLELLAAVAVEGRPGIGAGDDGSEVAHHLAAVADAQRKGVRALEEGAEFVACRRSLKQHGLGPALPGAEHVAVGEATAGGEAFAKSASLHAAGFADRTCARR